MENTSTKRELWFRVRNPLSESFPMRLNSGDISLFHEWDKLTTRIRCVIPQPGNQIISTVSLDVTRPILLAYDNGLYGKVLDSNIVKEIDAIFVELLKASKYIVSMVLQELRVEERIFLTSGEFEWSIDGVDWRKAPREINFIFANENIRIRHELNSKWQLKLQACLDQHEQPLIAIDFYLEALRGGSNKYTWIKAATAVELAVKEILVRLEPRLKQILLNGPAPPIHELYGNVLESWAGERSPYLSELRRGATKRNIIVHKPEIVSFKNREVVEYLHVVDSAISHLLKLYRQTKVN